MLAIYQQVGSLCENSEKFSPTHPAILFLPPRAKLPLVPQMTVQKKEICLRDSDGSNSEPNRTANNDISFLGKCQDFYAILYCQGYSAGQGTVHISGLVFWDQCPIQLLYTLRQLTFKDPQWSFSTYNLGVPQVHMARSQHTNKKCNITIIVMKGFLLILQSPCFVLSLKTQSHCFHKLLYLLQGAGFDL